ncbi:MULTISPECIES: guanylate kinase [unclassified Prochlorococcus]|uniref:guanylate kinase n=1 Tax=unclassified Prochlorococcus TaxID=2627481 RepID=UPI00053389C0|nr:MULTISPECIES: guanylate kinase [unclassified Prochlorococcus]KGG16493.1 Guanylate kinase [Prochlorococcus sp. MIT 0602]KGG17032.1 Guanylate kinase [Prochlorococcus sp. MIT 0603]
MTDNNGLTVITGPSGVGKGTLVKKLLNSSNNIWLSVSATTRAPRLGEKEGTDYFFLKKKDFKNLVEAGGFLEWAEFAGNFYGTPREEVQKKLSKGKKVLLEIELDGARQVRNSFPDGFQLFIAPPSFKELETRIRARGTDSEDAIRRRLKRASEEIDAQNEFDAVVINDDIDIAFLEIKRLIGL